MPTPVSLQIDTWFVKQFGAGVTFLSQQRFSKFRNAVMNANFAPSEEAFFDQIGTTEGQEVTDRYGDSPNNEVEHGRRKIIAKTYDWGKLVDRKDMLKTMTELTNPYVRAAGMWIGRRIDDTIISSFYSAALTGETGSTSTPFDTNNVVAVDLSGSSEGLTVAKLIRAKKILIANEVDLDMETPYVAISSQQWDDLLNETKFSSADYNLGTPLATGPTSFSFMGFNFILSERLPTDASAYRRCPVWVPSGMVLGWWEQPKVRIDPERSDKRFIPYAYYQTTYGATRAEEEKVVEIKCDES